MILPRIPFFTHQFVLSGLNLERFINSLQKEKIPLLSVRRMDERTLKCECYSADIGAIEHLVSEKGWRILTKSPTQLSARFLKIKQRPGILIGIALAMVICSVLMQFVWRIQILDAGSYQADIAQFLQEEGYTVGIAKADINADELTQKLTRRYPDIAWFQVYVYHMTMVVSVTQGVPMPDLPTDQTGDVIATRGGIVDTVLVFAGTALVEAGDIVQKGQVLIEGVEHAANEQWTPVQAQGQVMARCWQSEVVEMSLREIQSDETGNHTVAYQIVTPWFSIPETLETPQYLAYNDYISTMPIVGSFFPIYQKQVIHQEVSMQYVLKDFSEVKQQASDAALETLKFALYGYELIDKWVDYCMIEDDTLRATATAEWLMDIASVQTP